jgi:hypothetical protein
MVDAGPASRLAENATIFDPKPPPVATRGDLRLATAAVR